MKLRLLDEYRSAALHYPRGAIIEVDESLGGWLMRDAPEIFEVVKQITEPPEDKAIHSPPRSKGRRRVRDETT